MWLTVVLLGVGKCRVLFCKMNKFYYSLINLVSFWRKMWYVLFSCPLFITLPLLLRDNQCYYLLYGKASLNSLPSDLLVLFLHCIIMLLLYLSFIGTKPYFGRLIMTEQLTTQRTIFKWSVFRKVMILTINIHPFQC